MKKLLLMMLTILCLAAGGVRAEEGDEVVKQDPQKVQALRKQISDPKGPLESNSEYWVRRIKAAQQLGDLVELDKLIDQALPELEGDKVNTSFLQKRRKDVVLKLTGPSKKYFDIHEEIIRLEPNNWTEMYALSKQYINVKNFERAKELADLAELRVSKIKITPWVANNHKSKQLQYDTLLARVQGRYEDSARFAREHIPVGDWVANNAHTYNPLYVESYRFVGMEARLDLALALKMSGRFDEARKVVVEAGQLVSVMTMGANQQASVLSILAQIDLAEGHYKGALSALQNAEMTLLAAGFLESSPKLRDVRRNKIKALIGLGQFAEAEIVTAQLNGKPAPQTDAAVAGEAASHQRQIPAQMASAVASAPAQVAAAPTATVVPSQTSDVAPEAVAAPVVASASTPAIAPAVAPSTPEPQIAAVEPPQPVAPPPPPEPVLTGSPIDNAITLWRTGKAVPALGQIRIEVSRMTERYGAGHYFALRSLALQYSIEQQQSFDLAKQRELAQICEKLLAANEAQSKEPIEIAYRRQIYEAYLLNLAQSGSRDAGLIDTGFRLADNLRDSMVGRVLTDAACRSVTSQAALSKLVERQRTLKDELAASYDNLASVLGRKQEDRDEKVLAALRQALQAQQEEQIQVEREIARRFPEYNQLLQAETPQIKDIARLLGRGDAYVSILPGTSATFVWVITRDQAPVFHAAKLGEAELRTLVGNLRKTLDVGDQPINRMPAFDTASAYTLYDALLAPARGVLGQRSQLIVNAGGPLAQIPFSVLIESPASPNTPTTWLARHYTVTHISSNSAFVSIRQSGFRDAPTQAFIGFADPLFNLKLAGREVKGSTRNIALPRSAPSNDPLELAAALRNYDQLPPLPETRDEAYAMARALGTDPQKTVLAGKAANRQAVLTAPLADYQIVAFSTHGLMAGDLPGLTQPALALAATEKPGENPLLLLEDVMGLKLNADWVVLSACNTAAADGEASEALSGLGRGFFYAGARALLVTHWAVESESARQLVTETFKAYGSDKSLSRSEALRRAQLKLIDSKTYAHPFYWAPYALVGDGG